MLRVDIGRRLSECLAIGWLGRAYAASPGIMNVLFPAVFALSFYGDQQPCYIRGLTNSTVMVDVTLREASVVARGIPLQLRLDVEMGAAGPHLQSASLLGIGCDVLACSREHRSSNGAMPVVTQDELLECIGSPRARRLLARSVSAAMFTKLSPVKHALDKGWPLAARGPEYLFEPRREIFAREGRSDKWLQCIADYYFAAARVQEVAFARGSGVDSGLSFLFYLDESEPVNSVEPGLNVNPEVIFCRFSDGGTVVAPDS